MLGNTCAHRHASQTQGMVSATKATDTGPRMLQGRADASFGRSRCGASRSPLPGLDNHAKHIYIILVNREPCWRHCLCARVSHYVLSVVIVRRNVTA